MYDRLFEKGRIGNVDIKNRLVMTPMGTNLAELDGTAGPAMLAYFEARARGGCSVSSQLRAIDIFLRSLNSPAQFISMDRRFLSSFITPAVRVYQR